MKNNTEMQVFYNQKCSNFLTRNVEFFNQKCIKQILLLHFWFKNYYISGFHYISVPKVTTYLGSTTILCQRYYISGFTTLLDIYYISGSNSRLFNSHKRILTPLMCFLKTVKPQQLEIMGSCPNHMKCKQNLHSCVIRTFKNSTHPAFRRTHIGTKRKQQQQ